jgi:hypothetical protein
MRCAELDPGREIPALCRYVLELTDGPEIARLWNRERAGARCVLALCHDPAYFERSDCEWDLDWLEDTVTTLLELADEPGDWEAPPEFLALAEEWGYDTSRIQIKNRHA